MKSAQWSVGSGWGFGQFIPTNLGAGYWIGYISSSNATNQIKSDTSGNIYTINSNNSISKLNSAGTVLWTNQLNGTIRNVDFDSSGNVYVVGSGSTGSTNISAIVKYNSSGTLQWQRKLTSASALTSSANGFYSVTTDSSGNVYCGGTDRDSLGNFFPTLIKYDSSGTLLFQKKISFSLSSAPSTPQACPIYTISINSAGAIVCSGLHMYFNGVTYIYEQFINKFNSSGVSSGEVSIVLSATAKSVVDSSDNIYVASCNNTGNAKLFKYNTSLTKQWERTIAPASGNFTFSDIAIDSSNNLYIAGLHSSNYGTLFKLDSSANSLWQRKIVDTSSSPVTAGISTRVSPTGGILFGGRFRDSSLTQTSLLSKFPEDGSKTGTYTIDATHGIDYSALTGATISTTSTSGGLTATVANGTMTDAAGTLTNTSLSLTNTLVTI